MDMKEKSNKKVAKLNWFTVTSVYQKETIIFYLLTTLSCLGSYLISINGFKAIYETLKKGQEVTYRLN